MQRVNPWNNFPRNPLARYLGKALGHLWYLQALSLWALVVPLTVRRARYPITISVALSVVAMYLCTPAQLYAVVVCPHARISALLCGWV